jgi:hypothetical protein
MDGGRVRGVEVEGAESEGENQRGPSQRGRYAGGGLLPPPPLPKAEFIDPVFAKNVFFEKTTSINSNL